MHTIHPHTIVKAVRVAFYEGTLEKRKEKDLSEKPRLKFSSTMFYHMMFDRSLVYTVFFLYALASLRMTL